MITIEVKTEEQESCVKNMLKEKEKQERKYRKFRKELQDREAIHPIIQIVERAKSNNSTCNFCNQRIGKNTLRGVCLIEKRDRKYTIRAKYCSDCSITYLTLHMNRVRDIISKIRRIKKSRRMSYRKQEDMRKKDKILKVIEEKDDGYRTN